ncbi:hypothetical protein HNR55_002072 [Acetobacter lovaniensis]|mgnify:CR=1 FL=1|jgi:hypothetical protein|uniref:Uncharacterized protein n=1 Tax=Acetobacter lovaniensis TaxID=104100 RepID=A0A841QG96_9PROT|nr:hypothetical protein [Acetobacter lovaniensis]
MTPDNEFFLVLGGFGALIGTLMVGGILLLLSRHADPFLQMRNDDED